MSRSHSTAGTNAQHAPAGLRDVKSIEYLNEQAHDMPRSYPRWMVVLAIVAIPLSLLFVWGFMHLMFSLVFPNVKVVH